jgi:hypothetical protein
MVGRREIKPNQPKKGCDQPFGLAERQTETARRVRAVMIANAE